MNSFEEELDDIIERAVGDCYEYGQEEDIPKVRSFKNKILSKEQVKEAINKLLTTGVLKNNTDTIIAAKILLSELGLEEE